MARQLVLLVLGALLAFAALRVATPRRPTESDARLRRRRAEWLSVATAVVVGYLGWAVVARLNPGGTPDPRGAVAFVALVATVAAAIPLLARVWRRAAAARVADEAARAQPGAGGEPEPPARHSGLSGQTPPPTRW